MNIINRMNLIKLLLNYKLWIPLLLGFLMSFLCSFESIDIIRIDQQPPAIVFIIIWPILYLLLGYSFILSTNDIYNFSIHILIIIGLTLWIPIYSCLKLNIISLYLIVIIIGLIISSIILHKSNLDKLVLIPLLLWLFIAFQLLWSKITLKQSIELKDNMRL
jgi:tryptophan-rich sensory protein